MGGDQTLKLWHDTFAREVDSPRYRLSRTLLITGFALAFLYTVALTILGANRAANWINVSRPMTELAEYVVPAVGQIDSALVARGYAGRASYVSNVLAFQWLASGTGWLLCCILLTLERHRLSRAYAAAREQTKGRIPKPTLLNVCFSGLIGIALLARWLFLGLSFERRSKGYDLAFDNGALYFPFCAFTILWWACLYWGARHVIAQFGKQITFTARE